MVFAVEIGPAPRGRPGDGLACDAATSGPGGAASGPRPRVKPTRRGVGETPSGLARPYSPAVPPRPVRPFRLPAVRRVVAAALAVAVGLALAPAATAGARAESVRSTLDDEAAFEAGLVAARSATGDPLAAFARAYADAEGSITAEAVERLIGSASLSGVAPPPADETLARAQPIASASGSAATLAAALRLAAAVGPEAARPAETPPARRADGAPSQPRGP